MKKTLPVLLLASVTFQSKAHEFQKGQKLVGGSLSFSLQNIKTEGFATSEQKNTGFNIAPSFGIVHDKNTIYGAYVSYDFLNSKSIAGGSTPSSKSNSNGAGIGVYGQKLKWLNSKWFLFAQADLAGAFSSANQYSLPSDVKTTKWSSWGVSTSITPGISYRITPGILFDFRLNRLVSLAYNHSKRTNFQGATEATSTSKSLGLSSSLNNNVLGEIGIGMRWVLN